MRHHTIPHHTKVSHGVNISVVPPHGVLLSHGHLIASQTHRWRRHRGGGKNLRVSLRELPHGTIVTSRSHPNVKCHARARLEWEDHRPRIGIHHRVHCHPCGAIPSLDHERGRGCRRRKLPRHGCLGCRQGGCNVGGCRQGCGTSNERGRHGREATPALIVACSHCAVKPKQQPERENTLHNSAARCKVSTSELACGPTRCLRRKRQRATLLGVNANDCERSLFTVKCVQHTRGTYANGVDPAERQKRLRELWCVRYAVLRGIQHGHGCGGLGVHSSPLKLVFLRWTTHQPRLIRYASHNLPQPHMHHAIAYQYGTTGIRWW